MRDTKENLLDAVKAACKGLDDKFGKNITVLRIGKISILADYFIIVTGENVTQLRALSDIAEKKLYEHGIKLRHIEDYKASRWILMDFGEIILHLFCPEERDFYNLDAIWKDAEIVKID